MEEELICSKCSNVFEMPLLLKCCQNTICKCCLFKLFEQEVEVNCPFCKIKLTKSDAQLLPQNMLIVKMIEGYNN